MQVIDSMNKIKVALCTFGLFVGLVFPKLVNYFVVWIPERKALFDISCLAAGFAVGMFGYLVAKIVLNKMDKKYKEIIASKLGVKLENEKNYKTDALVVMQKEFEILLDEFAKMKANEDERLKKLATTDQLTGLYNLRFFNEFINIKLEDPALQMGILFCDIDHFKKVNDTFGHSIGDIVLKSVATVMKGFIGPRGAVFRYGGEEFVVLLEGHSLEQTIEVAEQLRLEIKNSKLIPCRTEGKAVTVSIGISHYPSHGLDVEALLDKSDNAMYTAKENGRDQCCIYKEA